MLYRLSLRTALLPSLLVGLVVAGWLVARESAQRSAPVLADPTSALLLEGHEKARGESLREATPSRIGWWEELLGSSVVFSRRGGRPGDDRLFRKAAVSTVQRARSSMLHLTKPFLGDSREGSTRAFSFRMHAPCCGRP